MAARVDVPAADARGVAEGFGEDGHGSAVTVAPDVGVLQRVVTGVAVVVVAPGHDEVPDGQGLLSVTHLGLDDALEHPFQAGAVNPPVAGNGGLANGPMEAEGQHSGSGLATDIDGELSRQFGQRLGVAAVRRRNADVRLGRTTRAKKHTDKKYPNPLRHLRCPFPCRELSEAQGLVDQVHGLVRFFVGPLAPGLDDGF